MRLPTFREGASIMLGKAVSSSHLLTQFPEKHRGNYPTLFPSRLFCSTNACIGIKIAIHEPHSAGSGGAAVNLSIYCHSLYELALYENTNLALYIFGG